MQKWEKGKYALKSIVAEIDTKVIELGAIGGRIYVLFPNNNLLERLHFHLLIFLYFYTLKNQVT